MFPCEVNNVVSKLEARVDEAFLFSMGYLATPDAEFAIMFAKFPWHIIPAVLC